MKKKILAVVLACVMVLSFAACGGSNESAAPAADGGSAEPIVLKCATLFDEGHPVVDRMHVFADTIEKETNGAITIKIYPSDQLGDSTVCFEEVMKGTIDMTWNAGASNYSELFTLPLISYLASNYDEAREIWKEGNWMYNQIQGIARDNNMELLGFDFVGVGGLGFTKKPDNYLEWGTDKNVVIRMPGAAFCTLWAEGMGLRYQTINYSELYSALQTGIVDGWYGGQPTVNYLSFGDVIKYYIQDDDFIETNGIYINHDVWASFTAEQQEIFMNAARALYDQSLTDLEEDTEYYLKAMEDDLGIEVWRLTDEEKADLAKHTHEEVWPKYNDIFGEETMKSLVEAYDFLQ